MLNRRGLMLVLSSPSGAGKTTISRAMLERDAEIDLSISHTTRPPRVGEQDGKDYHFCAAEDFQQKVASEEFLEHAFVFGNYYGTAKAPVMKSLEQGKDVLFDIDWQGTQQLAQKARDDLVSVFILPPSWDALAQRLKGRAQDPAEVIQARMEKASSEMSHWAEYDYVVVNEDLDKTIDQVTAILQAERLKRIRQVGLTEFVRSISV